MTNKVVDKNDLPGIIDGLQDLANYEVEAGIFGANATKYVPVDKRSEGQTSTINMLELAQILHEGCRIKVTPKMRAWFGYRGIHLLRRDLGDEALAHELVADLRGDLAVGAQQPADNCNI